MSGGDLTQDAQHGNVINVHASVYWCFLLVHVVTAALVYVCSADSGVIMTSSGYSDMFEFNQSGSKGWARCGEKKDL